MAARLLLTTLTAASIASAHFVLLWPETAGFIDDSEPTAPCGGATVTVNSSSPQVQVDRFAININSTHPAGVWEFRATTDTQEPYNFTTVMPTINTVGAGTFCLPSISVPESFAGKAGILQIQDKSVDGNLYQCAPVNFVSGSNDTLGNACTNNTGFTASFASQSSSASASASSSASGSASAAASSSTSTGGAAIATGVAGLMGGLAVVAAGLI